MLLLLPQRYVFSSKSQLCSTCSLRILCCYCYHKGTYFQANHNYSYLLFILSWLLLLPQRYVFSSKSQRQSDPNFNCSCCYCYHKGTYFQANHNMEYGKDTKRQVVIATTKVRIFKQITTDILNSDYIARLLLLPQRYVFSSKSQPTPVNSRPNSCCYCYHKGTYFQANHNPVLLQLFTECSCYCYHKGTYFQANHNSL